jgi:phosphoserine phosphatase
MRAHGAHTLLISGGFTYFTSRVAADAGFEQNQGNRLLDDGTALTGKVAEPICGRETKLSALKHAASRYGLTFDDVMAVGDGANDLDMIRRAGLGVAYHAKPVVAAAAGCSISHGDLLGLLYLQGYRQDEIATA